MASLNRCSAFFEAPHRIVESVEDVVSVYGEQTRACIAREMTKVHESVYVGTLRSLMNWVKQNPNNQKGEFVIIVETPKATDQCDDGKVDEVLSVLLNECSPSKSAELAARILHRRRNEMYKRAVELSESSVNSDNRKDILSNE